MIDYAVVNLDRVEEYRRQLPDIHLHLVTLAPGVPVALDRDRQRPEKTVTHFWTHLDEVMRVELNGVGLWVDNSTLFIMDTVNYILTYQKSAMV